MTDTSGAFADFFEDVIVVRGERADDRRLVQTVPACVLSDTDADAISDDSLASVVRSIVAVIRDEDWRYFKDRLQVGDRVKYDNVTYRISEATHDAINGWQIKAREVK